MTVKYQDDGFNEQTYERLFKTQEKVGEGLTPDNMYWLFTTSIDNKSKGEIEYLPSASINGISVNNMYELIAYLKTSKTETTYITKEFNILAEKSNFEIEIPDSYDGRNSFVLTSFNVSDTLNGSKLYSFQADPYRPINLMMRNRDGNSDPYKASFFINKTRRTVSFTIDNYDKDSLDGRYWYVKVLVLLWRII